MLARLRSAVLAVAVSSGVALTAAPAVAIHSGTPASTFYRPYVVALVDQDGRQFCGGTLVAPTKVVTAGHCIAGRQPWTVQVVAGRTDLRSADGQVRRASALWVHPRYDFTTYDVAVVTLRHPLPYETLPLALPQDTALYQPGRVASTFGWGRTTEEATGGSPTLRRATLRIAPPPSCDPYTFPEDPAWLKVCGLPPAGSTASICSGDSGGPLVAQGRLIGVVSTGNKYCRDEAPISVFTRTSTLPVLRRQVYGP